MRGTDTKYAVITANGSKYAYLTMSLIATLTWWFYQKMPCRIIARKSNRVNNISKTDVFETGRHLDSRVNPNTIRDVFCPQRVAKTERADADTFLAAFVKGGENGYTKLTPGAYDRGEQKAAHHRANKSGLLVDVPYHRPSTS